LDAWMAILLGLVQGIAEWFPISSSGHFVVIQHMLIPGGLPISFDIGLHVSTVLVLLIFFREDIWLIIKSILRILKDIMHGKRFGVAVRKTKYRRFSVLVVLAMIPTGIIGLLVDKFIVDKYMQSLLPVGVMFLVQGCLVLSTRWGQGTRKMEKLNRKDALAIGTMQGLSALSGLSRSGSTISVGVALGLDKTTAAKFSFIAGIPAFIGAAFLHIMEFTSPGEGYEPSMLLIGCITAFIVGFITLKGLIMILKGTRFYLFAIYSFIFGAVVLSLFFLGY